MPNFNFNINLDFLKNLFRTGITKEEFISAYSDMYRETGVTDEQLESMSIFDTDNQEEVASDLFDMLNINKANNGEAETLDADEILQFTNLDSTDGENTLSTADFNVLMKNYSEKLTSDITIDTPENMYETAMSKPSENGNNANAYMQSLEYSISALEQLANNRQNVSNQILLDYENEINTLIQNDNNVSSNLKSKYREETANLNNYINQKTQLEREIRAKQSELDSANAEVLNIQENSAYSESTEDGENNQLPNLAGAQENVRNVSNELRNLQNRYSGFNSKISRTQQILDNLKQEAKTQSQGLKTKIESINQKKELEQLACRSDIEHYNNTIISLRTAQTYAIERIQTEARANLSDSVGNGDDTYVYDESNYDEAAVAALEQRWSAKANKYGLDHKFFVKVTAISKDLKCDPNALLAVMNSECGLNPAARNPNGGATGLIQFMPSTAKALGTTTDALRNMSAYDQLDYVAKFFKMNMKTFKIGDGPMTAADLYSLIFLPARANRDVLTSQGENYYSANVGLDMDGDGRITKSDLNRRIQKCMA